MSTVDIEGLPDRLRARLCHVDDHSWIARSIPSWWSGSRDPEQARALAMLVPKLFCEHFGDTSLTVWHADGELAGFLIGLLSQSRADEAYIHFVGVSPDRRSGGLARAMYSWFFGVASDAGRSRVRAITSPGNTGSIAFHRRMGFRLEPSEHTVDNVPVALDYDAPGEHRVRFVRELSGGGDG